MDNTTQNTQMPPMQNQNPMTPESKPQGQGALIGSIIIIVLIVVGALYVIKNTKEFVSETEQQQTSSVSDEPQVVDTNMYLESQASVSTSDELQDIGTDIDSTDINSVDYGIDAALQ